MRRDANPVIVKNAGSRLLQHINRLPVSKDPGPKGPALVHPAGVIWVITFYQAVWFQVSGFRFQQRISMRCVSAALEKNVLSPVFTCSYKQIRVQDSVFTETWNLRPETLCRLFLWHSRVSLTWPKGPGFRFRIKINRRSLIFGTPAKKIKVDN